MKLKRKIVVFSGAGMSAESGISTFRDSDGLWENYRIEDVATLHAWKTDPELVTEFYNIRRRNIIQSKPNEAHLALSKLEQFAQVKIVTQNIDDLHERAGSSDVLHLHGNIRYAKSSGPNQESTYYRINGSKLSKDSCCPEGYRLRPHVVWFGEEVPALEEAARIISEADILIVIGTSLQVYPAAGLIHHAQGCCTKYIIDPKVKTMNIPSDFTCIQSSAVEGVETVISEIKKALNLCD
jgi:NAD-dependent deacetylase